MSRKLAVLTIATVLLSSSIVGVGAYMQLSPAPVSIAHIASTSPVASLAEPIPFPQATRTTGRSVEISVGQNLGAGAVIDRKTIITVQHVVGKQKIVLVNVGRFTRKWVPAVVVGHIHARPENVVILKILTDDEFLPGDAFRLGTGIRIPLEMVTPRGVFPWNPGTVVGGDSGSAVTNLDGELIGLVHGYRVIGKLPVVTILR